MTTDPWRDQQNFGLHQSFIRVWIFACGSGGDPPLLVESGCRSNLLRVCARTRVRPAGGWTRVGESVYVTVKPGIMKAEFYEGIKEYLVPLFAVVVFH